MAHMYAFKVVAWVYAIVATVWHSFRREHTFHARATTISERQVPTAVSQSIVIRF